MTDKKTVTPNIDNDQEIDISIENIDELEPKDAIKKLREKLKKCESEKQEYLAGWQRAKADYINARKQDEDSKKDIVKFANENLIWDIIPALDTFELAFANKEVWEKADKNWRIGIEHIYNNLKSVLEKNGLKEENPIGQVFDVKLHESIAHEIVDKLEDDHRVVAVLQKGYTLNGKNIRPAKVKVGEYKKP